MRRPWRGWGRRSKPRPTLGNSNRDLLSSYRGGSLARAENRPFVREFMRQVPSPGEEGALATPEGALSLEGERRISNALLQRAYGDLRLVSALAEAGDENVRTFGGALTDAAGDMARLRTETEAGNVPREFDISPTLTEAARVVQQARSKNIPLADFVAQQDAFNPISIGAEGVLRRAYGNNLRGRVSRANLADYLQGYAQEARQQSAEPQMFGDVVTPERILEAVGERYGQSTRSVATKWIHAVLYCLGRAAEQVGLKHGDLEALREGGCTGTRAERGYKPKPKHLTPNPAHPGGQADLRGLELWL